MYKQIALLTVAVAVVTILAFTDAAPTAREYLRTISQTTEPTVAHIPVPYAETAPPTEAVPDPEPEYRPPVMLVPKAEASPPPPQFTYLEVIESCGINFDGECVNVRTSPSTSSPTISKLRAGTILKVEETVEDSNGGMWHRITFDEWLRYPERVWSEWYVSADHVSTFAHHGFERIKGVAPTTTKRIVVDRREQMMYAYEGDELVMQESISTGRDFTPTPRGEFTIFRKTPSRYMQGPLQFVSDQVFDLPGVPWVMYFTEDGAAFHGTYWHANFGRQWSNGCVNLPPEKARDLYAWADLGTKVVVQN